MTGRLNAATRRRAASHVELVRWIASLGAVTIEALAARSGVTVESARMLLHGVRHKKLVCMQRPLTTGPALWTVTARGLAVAGVRGVSACSVSPSTARHLAECAAVAVELERRLGGGRLIGERELRRDERDAGASLASATLGAWPDGSPRLHRPDLVVWPGEGEDDRPLVVEVELTVKQPRVLREILTAWARCRLVSGVLYVASPKVEPPLARALERVRETQPRAAELVTVMGLEAIKSHPLLRPARPRPPVWRV